MEARNALKALEMPLIAVRTLGEGVLWLTERFVPSNPELPRIGANISIFEGGLETPPEPTEASGNQADTLSEEAA